MLAYHRSDWVMGWTARKGIMKPLSSPTLVGHKHINIRGSILYKYILTLSWINISPCDNLRASIKHFQNAYSHVRKWSRHGYKWATERNDALWAYTNGNNHRLRLVSVSSYARDNVPELAYKSIHIGPLDDTGYTLITIRWLRRNRQRMFRFWSTNSCCRRRRLEDPRKTCYCSRKANGGWSEV